MKRRLLVLITAGVLLLTGCGGQASPTPQPTPLNAPKAALQTNYVASDPQLVRATGRPQMLEFFAFWCDICQGMRPMIHQLQDQYDGQVDFIYLDIDAANTKQLQQDFGFNGNRPTLIFLSADGNEEGRLVGQHSKDEIAQQLDGLLAVG